MIKCEVINRFDLKDFGKLKNIQRKSVGIKGSLFVGDTFECDKEMVDYLLGNNALNKTVVKVVEVEIPEVKNVDESIERIEKSAKEEVELNEFGNPVGTREIKSKKKKTSKK